MAVELVMHGGHSHSIWVVGVLSGITNSPVEPPNDELRARIELFG
jgi:hypothetical protein